MARLNRLLLFGATGQLGERIVKQWSDIEIIAPQKSAVDVTEYSSVMDIVSRERPDLVLNATAFNDVAGAEKQLKACFDLNALAVDNMAQASIRADATFVTVSTDYVFDGELERPYTETDTPNPLNVYGISKLAGELLALKYDHPIYVIRTSGLYGTKVSSSKGYSFIDRILGQSKEGTSQLRVVEDQTISPTYAGHLATALRVVVDARAIPGIYHIVNEGAVTWLELAREAVHQAGLGTVIQPDTTSRTRLPKRPRFSALDNVRLRQLGGTMPDWREGVAAYLKDKATTGAAAQLS